MYYAILTQGRNHHTRCATIARTWGAQVPMGHLTFYSDSPDPSSSLPIVVLSNVTGYEDAQDRFTYLIMPHALARMEALRLPWLAWLDDDTFVWPENLHRLLAKQDATDRVWVGQVCGLLRGSRSFCGGAGFAMSHPLVVVAACVAPACVVVDSRTELPYDRNSAGTRTLASLPLSPLSFTRICVPAATGRMGVCLERILGLRIEDRVEFNSQPPVFYSTASGLIDRPRGFGHAVTFHYVRSSNKPITPEQHYSALYAVTRAAVGSSGK